MKLKAINETRGKAREYAPYGLTIFNGCSFGCTYCSVPRTKKIDKDVFSETVTVAKTDFLDKLKSDCEKLSGTDAEVLISFTSDPYNDLNESTNLTRKALLILNEYGIKYTVLTKGGMRAVRDFDIYKAGDSFATTLTFVDESKRMKWEPNAPSTMDRIDALKVAKEMGIRTWVSLEPVIDPVETLEIIKLTSPFVDLYKIGKLNYNKEVEDSVDWHKFVVDVENLLSELGNAYILKEGLIAYK